MGKKFFLVMMCLWFSFNLYCKFSIAPNLNFYGITETLDKISEIITSKEKGAYIRFGDGEISIAYGKSSKQQKWSKSLERELREAMSLNGDTILKALPLHNKKLKTYEYGMWFGGYETGFKKCIDIIKKIKKFWGADLKDVYSSYALCFITKTDLVRLKMLLNLIRHRNHCVFIGNKNVPNETVKLLFGDGCDFIAVSSSNAYENVDEIEKVCLEKVKANKKKYNIIITSMGQAGKALQKRLWKKLDNIFLLDFGSLIDALCGWKTKKWIKDFKLNENQFKDMAKKKVKFLCTAAILDNYYNERKKEYIKSLEAISKLGYEPYVVESCITGPSFLDEYSSYVHYPKINNFKLRNKGVNEARALIEAFKYFDFDDDDMIIKMTGRYRLADSYFVKMVELNIDADAVARYWVKPNGIFSGCFALKGKCFKDLLKNIDLEMMEKEWRTSIEVVIGNYLKKLKENGGKVVYLDKVHVWAYHFGSKGKFYKNNMIVYW